MDEKEFQELQDFGTGIEKTSENNDENKKEHFSKKLQRKKSHFFKKTGVSIKNRVSKTGYFFKKLLYNLGYICLSKIHGFFRKFHAWLYMRRMLSKNEKIAYRIVEKRKKRWNKTIVVRKRIPFYFN
ncbi:MAG: hypothetical protein V5A64_02445, partial [Candidatus Thermoplasmatota archaeon]